MSDSKILSVLARVYIDDLEAALPLYETLTGAQPHHFEYGAMRLARVGVFMLVEGAPSSVREHAATVAVTDVEAVLADVVAAGGQALEGPEAGPNGAHLVARHGDGNVFEYIEVSRV